MLRELLLALHGHTGDVFIREVIGVTADQSIAREGVIIEPKAVFRIDPNFSLIHPSERQVYDRLVQLGCYYAQLKEFSNLYSTGEDAFSMYANALKLGVAEILEGYEELIVKVEGGVLSGSDFDNGTTTVSYLMGIFTHYRIVFPDLIRFIGSVLSAQMKCAEILSYLYQRTFTGVPSLEEAYSTLSFRCNRVFYNQVLLWTGCGKVTDPYNEFFIACHNTKSHVEANNVPSWLSNNAATSILFIGRVVAAVQRIDPAHSSRDLQKRATERLMILAERRRLVPLEFELAVSELQKEISSELWRNVFSRHLDLKAYIRDFRNLFLLRFGGFFSDFFTAIQKKVQGKRDLFITEIDLFFNPNSPGFDHSCAANLAKFRFVEIEPPAFNFLGLIGCKTPVKWTYDLEWPLDLILQEADIASYSDIFSYLAGVRSVHLHLYKLSELAFKPPKWWSSFWHTKASMSFFLDSLWSYFQHDILEPCYMTLLADLENPELAYDFDSIQGLHSSYLAHIKLATLLDTKLTSILFRLLKVISRFTVMSYRLLEDGEVPSDGEVVFLKEAQEEFLCHMMFLFRTLLSLNSLPGHVGFKEKLAIPDNGLDPKTQTKSWDRASKTLDQLLLRLDYNKWFSLNL